MLRGSASRRRRRSSTLNFTRRVGGKLEPESSQATLSSYRPPGEEVLMPHNRSLSFGAFAGFALLIAVGYAIFKFEQITHFLQGIVGKAPPTVTEVLTSGET